MSVLVVGGGLAGSAVATLLARAGREVVLLEQYAEARHKMCGEFLSTEACESLLMLGVDVRRLGAVPVGRVRLVRRSVCVEGELPFQAWSLTRRVLDEAMLGAAAESGAEVRRGERVEVVEQAGDDWRVRMSGGGVLRAREVFCANGKHDLRGHPRPTGVQGGLIALKQYFRVTAEQRAELAGAVELVLFRGGYAGLQMVEEGWANLCLLVKGSRFKAEGGRWELLLESMLEKSPHLARRLGGAEPMLERPISLSRIPYGYVRSEARGRGLWWMGDQAAVIPSFSGDGMSIALHSARVAAEVFLERGGSEMLTARLHEELGRQVRWATRLSRMMVSDVGQRVVCGAVKAWPGLLARVASTTRVSERARRRLVGIREAE